MKIDFSFDTEYGVFSDAISLPDDHTFTDNEIEAIKKERLSNWIAILEAPPSEEVVETPIEEVIE
jgi:hypothetical protein